MGQQAENILEFRNIYKAYPGVQALNNVSFSLRPGEVHALVGENGAGKSTLIKTCSGAIYPDAGTITIAGEDFAWLTPKLSRQKGIAVIYQEFDLVNELSAAENIFLGKAIRKGWIIDRKAMNERSRELFRQLDIRIDPDVLVRDLTVGFQQMVEIAKALSEETKILIMDEPSAPLTNQEIEAMFGVVRRLKESGVAIVYISHRLDEIFQISDRVSVMRDGELLATMDTAGTDREQIVKLMVGRELKETFPEKAAKTGDEDVLLELDHVTGNGLKDISLSIKRGEILGLGGLIGAGRTELAQLLFGVEPIKEGRIVYKGQEIHPKSPEKSIRMGIALVPEDRKQQGVLLHMSIRDNISMPMLKALSKISVIQGRQENDLVERFKSSLRIKTPNIHQIANNLSGGNQQKVVLAKWLANDPEIIIFDEPTRGIDVGAKQEIYGLMDELVKAGKTLIMISSEMEELIGMSDRIVVLCEGRITGELRREEFDQEAILKLASMN
ncbi:MAG: sugar ABC transporter ATP-binding protein [Clostridiales Family XIII bacterium]|jgi:ribose transport system ATP-binding protein|nr:sugar ABC transporter ATP-binding protein [Clostridiales Family XIII bacterium]